MSYQLRVDHVKSTRVTCYARLTTRKQARDRPPLHTLYLFLFRFIVKKSPHSMNRNNLHQNDDST